MIGIASIGLFFKKLKTDFGKSVDKITDRIGVFVGKLYLFFRDIINIREVIKTFIFFTNIALWIYVFNFIFGSMINFEYIFIVVPILIIFYYFTRR